jgi:hypothetical protein
VGVKSSPEGFKAFRLLKTELFHTLSHKRWRGDTLNDLHLYLFSTGKGAGYYEYLY